MKKEMRVNRFKRFICSILFPTLLTTLTASGDFSLFIALENGLPVITWSNSVGDAFRLRTTQDSDNGLGLIETPYTGTNIVFRWSPSSFSKSMPIVIAVNEGYRFRIVSMSNDVATGSAWLQWSSISGCTYRIIRTTNPANWGVAALATNIIATNIFHTFHDTTAGLGPQYYAIDVFTNSNWIRTDNAAGFYTIQLSNNASVAQIRNDFAPLNGMPYSSATLIRKPQGLATNALLLYPPGSSDFGSPFIFLSAWSTSTLTASGWSPEVGPLLRGQCFLLFYHSSTGYLSFAGELPSELYAATSRIEIINNGTNPYHFISYPYPVEIHLTNTTLWKEANRGDRFMIFSNLSFIGWTKGTSYDLSFATLRRGQGFFYQSVSTAVFNRTWSEIKPYSWP